MKSFMLPENASTFAQPFDHFGLFMLVLCGGVTFAIFMTIFAFVLLYHRKKGLAEMFPMRNTHWIEWTWTAIPLSVFIFIFWWGTRVYLEMETIPTNGIPVFVLGKQWMWEFEHSGGQREINELHVPVGRPVRLTMASQDVIHSFFVPAFRIKQDLVPGRYTYTWFTATKPGEYRILCAELCGTNHSEMGGYVYVMNPQDYEQWLKKNESLAGRVPEQDDGGGSLVELGRTIFEKRQCVSCHSELAQAPSLRNIYGRIEDLEGGGHIKVDENYLLESIVRPSAKITKGYKDIMPSFQGQLTDRELRGLVEYLKTGDVQ